MSRCGSPGAAGGEPEGTPARLLRRHHSFPLLSGLPVVPPGDTWVGESKFGARERCGLKGIMSRGAPDGSHLREPGEPTASAALRKLRSPGCVAATLYQSCRPPGD